ncbi:hypothetical protein ACFZB9_17120 [Kitasatospora sp. NPDC008050]|uniref:hypothetical protein n=1 Tax=unclassified Kitasatospora TaxID=2633591 RepID=UPI002E10E3D4|nr:MULTISPECIES: hypothetical protein [unclassified Kitasatospora]WSJ66401.1 hypothetical protein OG294_09855 [Kitasatospora sp. NBC_01302]
MTSHDVTSRVGARSREQVESALARLEYIGDTPFEPSHAREGALDGYRWALGRGRLAPVTASVASGPEGPCPAQLGAEQQAAQVRHLDLRLDAEVREYARGVHDAIAWVSGRSDVQP